MAWDADPEPMVEYIDPDFLGSMFISLISYQSYSMIELSKAGSHLWYIRAMMAENQMKSSLDTRMLILSKPLPSLDSLEGICAPQKGLAQIRLFEVFGFRYILLAPNELAWKMSESMG